MPPEEVATSDKIQSADIEALKQAKFLLERPSLASKITSLVGTPIEAGFKLLPERWSQTVNQAVQASLWKALSVAVKSLGRPRGVAPRVLSHKLAAMASGATGGALGLPGLVVELPISTTIMLRSIADIARSEGENIASVESQLACIEVFALGGRSSDDDAAETGYFAVRSALAHSVSEAARYITEKGVVETGAPPLVRLLTAVSSRFGIVVSEKVAAMAVPIIGSAAGALINSIFIEHFQDMARGHFIVRGLERRYSKELVQLEYQKL